MKYLENYLANLKRESHYLIGRCFEDFTELEKMSETELNNLVRLANFASEAFY